MRPVDGGSGPLDGGSTEVDGGSEPGGSPVDSGVGRGVAEVGSGRETTHSQMTGNHMIDDMIDHVVDNWKQGRQPETGR